VFSNVHVHVNGNWLTLADRITNQKNSALVAITVMTTTVDQEEAILLCCSFNLLLLGLLLTSSLKMCQISVKWGHEMYGV